MNIKKPNSFARYGNDYVAPLTTIDQIVKPSGERYTDKEFELMSNVENVMFGDAAGKNLLTQKVVFSSISTTYNNGTITNTSADTISSLNLNLGVYEEPRPASSYIEISDTFTKQSGYDYLYIRHNGASRDIGVMFDISNLIDGETYTLSYELVSTNPSVVGGLVISNLMIEQGSTATEYEPYIKSLKGLTDSALNMDLLWTNASPTSSFGSQTISLDLSVYKLVCIVYKYHINSDNFIMDLYDKRNYGKITHSSIDDARVYYKTLNVQDNGITFGDSYYFDNYGASILVKFNDINIPYQIYGVK